MRLENTLARNRWIDVRCTRAESAQRQGRPWIAVALAAFLVANFITVRLQAQPQPPQYISTVWRTEQGLPQNSVNAMVQDHEGYLWIGTFGGLARFDGERFKVFTSADTPGFASARIRSLYESRSGALWVGTVDGGLMRLHDGSATTYTEHDGLPPGVINSLREDGAGQMWINTSRGVAHFAGTKLEAYVSHRGKPVSEFYLQEQDGSMWFQCGTKVVRFGADGSITTLNVGKPNGLLARKTRDGSVWIGWPEPQYRLARYHNGVFSDVQLPQTKKGKFAPDSPQLLMAYDSDGELLLLTPAGLVRVVDGKLGRPEALPWPASDGDLPKVRRLLVDREGNRWVGTIGSGLLRFRRTPLIAYGREEGLANSSFSALFQDREGRFWMGGDSLYWFYGSQFHLFPGISNIRAISQTRDGAMWFGGYGGLYRWRSGTLTHFDVDAPAVRTIHEDRQGTLWIGAIMEDRAGCLYRFRDGRLEQIPGISDVRTIQDDRDGSLWLGGLQGLSHITASGNIVLYDQKQGLSNNAVYDIYQDSTGTLWLATYGGGLNRFRDGKFKAITTKDGLSNNMLLDILDDGNGDLWVSSNQNIFRFGLNELNDFLDGRSSSILPVSYGIAEGMRSSECNGGSPGSWRTPDGRLWFPTLRGVVAVDPNAGSRLPPPVVLEEAWANQLALAHDVETSIRRADNTLNFRFTVLSFSAPEKARFKYRLEPFYKDWVDAGTRRDAHYTNMPPGKYSFQVVAANSYGVLSQNPVRLNFVILPAFYETNWFRLLCAAMLVGMLWMLYQLRLSHIAHQFNMTLEARVSERTRIARELHDTLLQSFYGLLMSFQTAARLLPGRPTEAKERLDHAIEQAEGAIMEGRDAVQGLRASMVQSNDLALAINTLGEELATDSNNHPSARFHVAVEGVPRDLHPILRDEIYRIAAEALRNAFRHAQAQQIEVEIRYDDQQFRLRVRDDGRGFDPAVSASQGREGHYGLPGMSERAKIVGGKLTVWSEVDAGTEVDLQIPASAAYATAQKRSWLSEKLSRKAAARK